MDASQLKAEQESIEEDILKLQLHSVPLNLNWDSQGEQEEEEDDHFDEQSYLLSAIQDPDQPSTSGLNSRAGPSGYKSSHTSNALTTILEQEGGDDETLGEGEEELIDLSKDLDATPRNILKLNLAYQEALQQQLLEVEELIMQNKTRQDDIAEEERTALLEDQQTNTKPRASLGLLTSPYFKNSTMPCQSFSNSAPMPLHQDVQRRIFEIGEHFLQNPLPAIKWRKDEQKKLQVGVERVALKQATEPVFSTLEYLEEKLSTNYTPETKAKIEEVQKQLEAVKTKPMAELVGDRAAEHDWDTIGNIDLETTRTAIQCELIWKNSLHPSISHLAWTASEEENLKKIVRKNKEKNWKTIAAELGTGRTALQCIQRFQRKNTEHKQRAWTPEADAQLIKLVEKFKVGSCVPYAQIALVMGERTAAQVSTRWIRTLNPEFKRSKWSPEEDTSLLQAILKYGPRWALIRDSGMVPGRNSSQCRERWECALRYIKRDPWTKSEDDRLTALIEEHGEGKWSKMAAAMEGRSDNQVMNRWKKLKKRKAEGATIIYDNRPLKKPMSDDLAEVRQKLLQAIDKKIAKFTGAAAPSGTQQEDEEGKDKNLADEEGARLPKNQVIRIKGGTNRKISPSLQQRLSEVKSPQEMAELYHQLYVHELEEENKKKAAQSRKSVWARSDRKLGDMIVEHIKKKYKPFKYLASMEGTNLNEVSGKIEASLTKMTAPALFKHYVQAMNINAETTLKAISSKSATDDNASTNGGTTEQKPPSQFVRNHFLPFCVPNLGTVSAYRKLMLDKERRVRNAKKILLDNNGENTKKQKTGTKRKNTGNTTQSVVNSDEHLPEGKYDSKELMRNIQLMHEHRILRGRFFSLFAWPTVLSTLVPYERVGSLRTLRPVLRIQRPEQQKNEENSPPAAKKTKVAEN